MNTRQINQALGAMGVLALALVGCAGGPGGSGGPGGYGAGDAAGDEPAASASLETADSDLGEIVVDGEGMTLYMFDSDTQGSGESTCTGECLANWPPVTVDGSDVEANGVTGEIGTIETAAGSMQVTLDGWPLYYFAGDSAPGDVTGQAVNDVWWVLGPDGAVIRD